jgi:hypothetical protein
MAVLTGLADRLARQIDLAGARESLTRGYQQREPHTAVRCGDKQASVSMGNLAGAVLGRARRMEARRLLEQLNILSLD